MNATRDKYDEAIDWLVEHADDPKPKDYDNVIEEAWDEPSSLAHDLFLHATPNGTHCSVNAIPCGCLTQIRGSEFWVAWTTQLTAEIREDKRIPETPCDLYDLRGDELRAALQPFAEWQRRLDREIRGVSA